MNGIRACVIASPRYAQTVSAPTMPASLRSRNDRLSAFAVACTAQGPAAHRALLRRCAVNPRAYVVESGKPIPDKNARIYPFDEMKFGDSFGVPFGEDGAYQHLANMLRASATNYSARNGTKFTTRIVHRDGEVRCWRIA